MPPKSRISAKVFSYNWYLAWRCPVNWPIEIVPDGSSCRYHAVVHYDTVSRDSSSAISSMPAPKSSSSNHLHLVYRPFTTPGSSSSHTTSRTLARRSNLMCTIVMDDVWSRRGSVLLYERGRRMFLGGMTSSLNVNMWIPVFTSSVRGWVRLQPPSTVSLIYIWTMKLTTEKYPS